ncbi:hypothetical protein ACOSP7_027255 [Xanthoceras sorbifolium]|uniref:S-adenosyl-L-methionine-dependent methyltransferase n=1 Tax=Xanthoceras sorbifolium TaxID=99658 RepID=A0ABQ8HFT1_9ROSI|nr:hypothetical protein JRO89_XS11G0162900 [Xanthoceras sorbifolium]KAH7557486.1 hypothetical protein JRO89_XS11G0163600 [Xanthoceras sorbifolium]
MACWSAENATKAYLKTLKMGQTAKEPNEAEFISALAAGNNAQLMVVACAYAVNASTLALVAAAHQTGGRVVCILQGLEELILSKKILGLDAANHVEFVIGDAQNLMSTHYREADFVLIDCNLENHEGVLRAVQASGCRKRNGGAVMVGYNAFSKGSWPSGGSKTQLLPIGEGLLVTRITTTAPASHVNKIIDGGLGRRKSHWIVKFDQCTGEEHVFRVRFPQGKQIEA